MRRLAILLLALLPAVAGAGPRPLTVTATPVGFGAGDLAPGVRLAGVWDLASDDADFGGISGLWMAPAGEGAFELRAITDRGRLIHGRLTPGAEPAFLGDSRPLTEDGVALEGDRADAEGFALDGRAAWVGLERDHRVMALDLETGALTDPWQPENADALGNNAGVEALAVLPDGRLYAIVEDAADGAFPAWLLGAGATRADLPAIDHHAVTGADLGPDGRLYVLQRFWSRATGNSMRLLRYGLGPDGVPDPASVERLAGFEAADGTDNMEGLALTPRADGRLDAWVMSDDNFNPTQRSLLMRLVLDPA